MNSDIVRNRQALLDAVRHELEPTWTTLPDKPDESLERTVRALWFAAAGIPRSIERCSTDDLPAIDAEGAERLRGLARQRAAGVPIAHLTGRQSFCGLELLSGPQALIPRRETELLAQTAIARLRAILGRQPNATAIDVCTGSGNVALAMAAADERVRAFGADISPDAVSLAQQNALHLGLADRASFHAGDLFAPLHGVVPDHGADLVTCNPPYITSAKVPMMPEETQRHEPRLAFDGGAFGLDIITRLLADGPRVLRPGAPLCFEVGAATGKFVADRVRRNPAFATVEGITDAAGVVRVLVAVTRQ